MDFEGCRVQYAFQGSETETRKLLGGTKESNIVRPQRNFFDLPSRNDILQTASRKKMSMLPDLFLGIHEVNNDIPQEVTEDEF